MDELRFIVCGGRYYKLEGHVWEVLDLIRNNYEGTLVVIEGGQRGADEFAGSWAETNRHSGIEHRRFRAHWDQFGSAAGSIRNREMIDEGDPHFIVAFPGGRGTKNMIDQARQENISVMYSEDILEIYKIVDEELASA